MKVFISQPMNGLTKEQIKEARERAINNAKLAIWEERRKWVGADHATINDIEIIDSYFEDYNPEGGSVPLKYLAKSLELLADADIAYFCKNWKAARGCSVEYVCATEYGITVIVE